MVRTDRTALHVTMRSTGAPTRAMVRWPHNAGVPPNQGQLNCPYGPTQAPITFGEVVLLDPWNAGSTHITRPR